MPDSSLAVFDLDGTITRHDTLWPYIWGFLRTHPGRWWRLAPCLAPLIRYLFGPRDRGQLKGAVIRWTLGGLNRTTLAAWSTEFTARVLRGGLYAEALTCITSLRRESAYLVLLSASPDLYVPAIAKALGFDECVCSVVRWRDDDTLDGTLATANRRGPEKAKYVRALLAKRQPRVSRAFGNSDADLEHLQLVTVGTYVNGPARDLSDMPNVRAVTWHTRAEPLPV